ncbi:MAG TPA: BTAD domain-containing putative transcriptional regulator, partial [Candidatus Limnocylindrales bacterium]
REQLIQALWGADPPVTAVKSLNRHVAVVRRALDRAGLDGVLARCDEGFTLEVPRETVDAQRFSDAVGRARKALRARDQGEAIANLQSGLSLWRGDVMTGCAPAGWGAADAARLRELRVLASQGLWQVKLGRGEVGDAVAELERLVAAYPLQERFWELLMLALSRSGRGSEALLAFDRLAAVLKAELAVEPSPRLCRLRDRLM